MKKISKEKKVWIFKWLLKKHGCLGVHLEKDFFKTKRNKKVECFRIILDMDDGERYVLGVDLPPDPKMPELQFLSMIAIPFKYNISYADVLDGILKAMKKNDSDCWMGYSWSNQQVSLFLKRDATLEELSIEFDLSWRDAFKKA